MLERIGRGAARRHWWVIAAWLVVLVAVGAAWRGSDGRLRDVFTIPGTESQQAIDLFEERFPELNLPTGKVVLHDATGSLEEPAARQAVAETIAKLERLQDVQTVTDPYTEPFLSLSSDKRTAAITVTWSVGYADVPKDAFEQMQAAAAPARAAGLDVEYGGGMVDILTSQGGASDHADEIGLLVALLVMLVAFGSVLAAALPLANALFGIGTATALLYVLADVFTIGTIAPILGTMIGLGVGIDYALFIVTRYREELATGLEPKEAVARAVGTAGAAVLFAGLTVCLALLGLVIARVPYVTMLGLSAALVVAVMVLVSLTLLPALLGLIGRRIDALRIPLPRRRRREAAGRSDRTGGFWARWAEGVARHPWPCLVAGVVILLLLAAPVLSMQLGFVDDGDEPRSETQRRAYDLVAEAFGPGANGPLLVAIELPRPTSANEQPDLSAVETLEKALTSTTGVQSVSPPLPNSAFDAAVILVQPRSDPNDDATKDLVRRLRATVIPDALRGTALPADRVFVGGPTAELIDVSNRINEQLRWCILAVVAGAFVLLLVVFRSILVPLKAAVLNVLSIAAAYGIVVAVFQWGWARQLVGLEQTVPIEAFVPLMMFAILFGLSMDYEVFLLSRIREEYVRTGDNRASVVSGLSRTARVITSAALIMISVFLSFVLSGNVIVKMMGVGLAAAVFVDATIVRLILVPAVMELMGRATWWFPRWLDRIVPHIELEGAPPSQVGQTQVEVGGVDAAVDLEHLAGHEPARR